MESCLGVNATYQQTPSWPPWFSRYYWMPWTYHGNMGRRETSVLVFILEATVMMTVSETSPLWKPVDAEDTRLETKLFACFCHDSLCDSIRRIRSIRSRRPSRCAVCLQGCAINIWRGREEGERRKRAGKGEDHAAAYEAYEGKHRVFLTFNCYIRRPSVLVVVRERTKI